MCFTCLGWYLVIAAFGWGIFKYESVSFLNSAKHVFNTKNIITSRMIIRFAAILNVTFASDSHFPPNREILSLLKKIGTNQVRSNQNCHQVSTI